jgi:hypothetical protein
MPWLSVSWGRRGGAGCRTEQTRLFVARFAGSKGPFWPQNSHDLPSFPTAQAAANPTAGNGIFGCRDWEAKLSPRDRKCHRMLKEQNDTGENPHRNGLF